MTNTLPLQHWLDVVRNEYLEGFVKKGGSSIKFAVPSDIHLSGLLNNALACLASDSNYVVVSVNAEQTPVHMPQEIFFAIASQLDWRSLARRVILRLAEDAGYFTSGIAFTGEESIVQSISNANSVQEQLVALELRQRMPEAVMLNGNMSRDFRMSMTHLCLTEIGATGQNQESSALVDWLTGVNRRVSSVRAYSIYNTIVRTNAKHFFESLLYWVRYVGYSGTVVLLDNSRVTLRRNPRDGLRFYSRSAVMDHYELLRELIDSTDRLEGFFMVVVANDGFLDDGPAGKGFSIYQALMGRIADEVRDRSHANPMSALVRLSDTAPWSS